jgi:hypothetical protein
VKFEPVLFMVKRIMFVFCVFYIKNASISIPLSIAATTVNLAFFLHIRPYEDETVNNLEIFGETVTCYFLMFLLALLKDYRLSHNMSEFPTWMTIGVLWVYLMTHIIY